MTLKEQGGRDATDVDGNDKEEAAVDDKDVRRMNVDELCQWLKTKLDDQEWKVAKHVIRNQLIKVKNFLNYTLEQWVKVTGLPAGVADSLVKIAQCISEVRVKSFFQSNILKLP